MLGWLGTTSFAILTEEFDVEEIQVFKNVDKFTGYEEYTLSYVRREVKS